MNNLVVVGISFDKPGYWPAERNRHKLLETRMGIDGQIEIVDNAPDDWVPTQKQANFLAHLFEEGGDSELSIYGTGDKLGLTMREIKRWCRQEPRFLALLEQKVEERKRLSMAHAKLTVMAMAEGIKEPKWYQYKGAEQLIKMQQFVDNAKLKLLMVHNQINNYYGVSVDMTDEQLEQVIDKARNGSRTAIKAGGKTGESSGRDIAGQK